MKIKTVVDKEYTVMRRFPKKEPVLIITSWRPGGSIEAGRQLIYTVEGWLSEQLSVIYTATNPLRTNDVRSKHTSFYSYSENKAVQCAAAARCLIAPKLGE